jgi:DNA-binding transcriptional LysR family regulator
MNLDSIRLFCDVINEMSFSRGAKLNKVSQSAATQSIHRIEKELGVSLIDRSHRPFAITPEGEVCYDAFSGIIELFDSASAKVHSLREEISGTVRVGAIYSVGLHDMSVRMQQFMREYSKAKVQLEYLRPDKVYDEVMQGQIDLGIVSYPTPSREISVIPMRDEKMVLIVPPDHRLASFKEIDLKEIADEPLVAFSRDLPIRKDIDRYLRKRGVMVPLPMEFDNIETIKQAVQVGSGISILPEPTIRREREIGVLVDLPIIDWDLKRPIGILHRHRKIFTPTAQKFIEFLLT